MQVNTLTHPTMQAKLFAAMQRARLASLNTGFQGVAFIKNKHGKIIATVQHYRGEHKALQFFNVKGENITANVLTSLAA